MGMLDSLRWSSLDANLTTLANIEGACERIKNMLLPRQISSLLHAAKQVDAGTK
ncbi:hypothetical protein [Xanthomonas populi]|uniref:hypothetical protein n=1 Tax=Xanthomonas populi TaxID=53414 RepID=UPI001FC95407|nr:hypothetical protein [Xanthomonas populi]